MPVRPIVAYPDPRLRQPAAAVTQFDDELRSLAADLVDTLRAAEAFGITAPHVGIPLQVMVIQLGKPGSERIYVNPRIVSASSETARQEEGSVSMPGFTEKLERPARIQVAYQDLQGVEQIEEAEGLLAVCHQHEIDQLAGIFWIDRLSRLKRDRLLKRYAKG
jgi:peptide deformylase